MEMSTFSIASIVLILITHVLMASIAENDDGYQELHSGQEELQSKLHHFDYTTFRQFETMMKSEVKKLKFKMDLLENKVQEQNILIKDCHRDSLQARQSDKNIRGLDPKTCFEAYSADPSLESGMYWIDPDGQGRGDDSIHVYCNMTTGSTSILHDSEYAIDVGHCLDPGCYSRLIKYNATLRQMVMLSELSNECRQSIRVDCFDTALDFNRIAYAWWNDRNGDPRYFWSGKNNNASSRYHTCQCGLDDNCHEKSLFCNCDSNLAMNLADTGVILDKDLLPVTKLNFGRTIAPTSSSRHTLGRMECSGKVVLNGMPTSCQDLWRISYTLSGLYSIKGSSGKVETVYCDFSKLPGDEGLQTWIGYSEVKSTPVYFNVQRNSSYNTVSTALPYDVEILNVGNGLNTSSGIFTAPRAGIYYFTFSSFGSSDYLLFSLQLNDVQVATCSPNFRMYSCNFPYTVELELEDRVQVILLQGSTNIAIFTGWLIAENVFDSSN